jgi:glycosyltransferase involved in cell wall biosynthesis
MVAQGNRKQIVTAIASRMKLLVFAHTPPPHHGQSYMVQLMLDGLGGDHRQRLPGDARRPGDEYGIQCYHVNTRLSKRLEDIGEFHGIKLIRLLIYSLEAIWCRFRFGVTNFYYIPAPGKSSALYRDWMIMAICRPFFKKIIFHWHAAGLAKWLETSVQLRTRSLTYRFARQVDLSVVLSRYNLPDAEKLLPQRTCVVGNGIPDPCPDFKPAILPRRLARSAAREKLLAGRPLTAMDLHDTGGDPQRFKVLFLAHCTREKGLFDAIEAVALANADPEHSKAPVRVELTVAGEFLTAAEQAEFEQRIQRRDLEDERGHPLVRYIGFVRGETKKRAFVDADCFCFPTYYYAESFGLVVVEAMAAGLPIITTRWRSLAEMMPANYPGLVEIRSPQQVALAIRTLMKENSGEEFREMFLARFTLEAHLTKLAQAIASLDQPSRAPRSAPAPAAF